MPCVYILHSDRTNKFYMGSSREDDALSRLRSHNQSKTRSTKSGIPWRLIHEEKLLDYTLARKREIFLKSGVGRQWVDQNFGQIKLERWQSGRMRRS